MLLSWALTPRGTIENDVGYYFAWTRWASAHGFSGAMTEYPTPALLLLWLPSLIAPTEGVYSGLIVGMGVLVVLVGALALWSLPGRNAGVRSAVVFLACVGALGPITFFRFDLLPGMAVAVACVALARGRRGWSVAIGLGTGIKLWPIIVWALALGDRRNRRREVIELVVTGISLVVVSVAVAGWGRLFSPLSWQSGRGLQVESVLATWVLVARLVAPSTWKATLSDANSWDFSGPGIAVTTSIAGLLSLVLLVWIIAICTRVWRTGAADPLAVSLAASSIIAVLVATDKVFSPQYLMWLVPVAAVAIGLGGRGVPQWWAPVLVGTTFITQLSYPTTYGWLYSGNTGSTFLFGTLIMVVRNVALVVLAVSLCRAAWSAASPRPSAPPSVACLLPAGRPTARQAVHPSPEEDLRS